MFLPAFVAVFVPGPAPIFGWPVPVLETVVVTGWPVVREPERKGKIAYTISETIATTATVSREPMTRARAERKTLSGPAAESRQVNGQPRILRGEPPLNFREHALLVHRQRHGATSASHAGVYALTIPHHKIFIQSFWRCRHSFFRAGSGPHAPGGTADRPEGRITGSPGKDAGGGGARRGEATGGDGRVRLRLHQSIEQVSEFGRRICGKSAVHGTRPYRGSGAHVREYANIGCHPRIGVLESLVCDGITCVWTG